MTKKIRFYGVRGSLARPGLDHILFGGNTPCVLISWDKELLIIDTGTGIFELGQELKERKTKGTILYSHYHWDHMIGLPFFAPMYESKNSFDIIGRKGLKKALTNLLSPPNFPVRLRDFKAKLKLKERKDGPFKIGKIVVDAFEVKHPNGAFGYRFYFPNKKSVVFISDNGPSKNDSRLISKIFGADILIHDAQYLPKEFVKRKRFGHSPYHYVLDLARKAFVRDVFLFHHDPSRKDVEIEKIEKEANKLSKRIKLGCRVVSAREGMEITL